VYGFSSSFSEEAPGRLRRSKKINLQALLAVHLVVFFRRRIFVVNTNV